MDDMRYFTKIYELVLKLQNCGAGGMTKREIADFMGCSMKTVERKMTELERLFGTAFIRGAGYPATFRIKSARLPKSVSFNANDVSVLRNAAAVMRNRNRSEEAGTLSLLAEKVQILLDDRESRSSEALAGAESTVNCPAPRRKIDASTVDLIKEAIKTWTAVSIDYTVKRSRRTHTFTLCPYGILHGDRNSYLLAADYDNQGRENVHFFILSNIRKIAFADKKFIMPENFSVDDFIKDMFGMYNEEPIDVEWLFSPQVADEAAQFVFHSSQATEKRPDGSLLVRFRAGGVLDMAWHLYTWNGRVKVLKPADFWRRVADARKRMF